MRLRRPINGIWFESPCRGKIAVMAREDVDRTPAVNSPRQEILITVLAAAAGIVDALSYLNLGKVFPANMTGNTVLLGNHLITGAIVDRPTVPPNSRFEPVGVFKPVAGSVEERRKDDECRVRRKSARLCAAVILSPSYAPAIRRRSVCRGDSRRWAAPHRWPWPCRPRRVAGQPRPVSVSPVNAAVG